MLPATALDDLTARLDAFVPIRRIELLRAPQAWFCRITDGDGDHGVAAATSRMNVLWPIFLHQVAPAVVGRDLAKLRDLGHELWRHQSNYKLGLAARSCIAAVEMACLDLIGRKLGQNVGDLAGGRRRGEIDVYLSHTGRGTTAEQEVEMFAPRLAATGARALKYKVGGRMSHNADAAPNRSEVVTAALRNAFPDHVLWADANGSYNAAAALDVAAMLAGHDVTLFEEPCPFDDPDDTRRVTAASPIPVAGGEQDHAWPTLRRMVDERVIDVLQPDPHYVGGLGRLLAVAAHANQRGLPVAPHSPKTGPEGVGLLHAAALIEHVTDFHEWSVHPERDTDWYAPALIVRDGRIAVPTGPGLGLEYDPAVLAAAEVVVSVAV
jgi:L-alanine-DL-glutamate epimerase-like enolase superfamily enzyme